MESRRFKQLFPTESPPRARTPVVPVAPRNPPRAHSRGVGSTSVIPGSNANQQQREIAPRQHASTTGPVLDQWARQLDRVDRWMAKVNESPTTTLRTPSRQASLTTRRAVTPPKSTTTTEAKRPSSRSSSFTSTSSPRVTKPAPTHEESPRAAHIPAPISSRRFLDPGHFKFKCNVSATISDAMRRRGWRQITAEADDSWNIFWCDMGQMRELYYRLSRPLDDSQRVGHFRNSYEISRKNMMARNLRRFKSRMEKQFGKTEGEKLNFFPQTFILPDEHSKFLEEFRRDPTVWVIKPAAGAQGRGIFIFSKLKDYYIWRATFDPVEVQRRRLAAEGIQMPKNPADEKAAMQQQQLDKYVPPVIGPGGVYLAPVQPSSSSAADSNAKPPDGAAKLGKKASGTCIATPNSLTLLSTYVEPAEADVLQASAVRKSKSRTSSRSRSRSGSHERGKTEEAAGVGVSQAFPTPAPTDTDDDPDDTDTDTAAAAGSAAPSTTTSSTQGPMRHEIFVVQKYILNPYLLGGRKFDLRLYILVESFSPLKVWVHREGFARFSGGQYNINTLQDIYVHLTNVAIQKTSENYDSERGSKWPLYELRAFLLMSHGPAAVHSLFCAIDNIIVRTLQSVQHVIYPDKHCFELYGFDVLIDETLKAWLLEVNSSPAFTPSSEHDYRLKCSLIDDVVHVLDLEKRLTGFEKRVGGFDLVWNGGPVYTDEHALQGYTEPKLNSFIGCHNDRVNQLYSLFQLTAYAYGAQSLNAATAAAAGTNQEEDGELKPPSRASDLLQMGAFANISAMPKGRPEPHAATTTGGGEFVPIDIARVALQSKEMDPNFKVPDCLKYGVGFGTRGATRSYARMSVPPAAATETRTNVNPNTMPAAAAINPANGAGQMAQSLWAWPLTTPAAAAAPSQAQTPQEMTMPKRLGFPIPPSQIRRIAAPPIPYKTYVNDVFSRLSGSGPGSNRPKYK